MMKRWDDDEESARRKMKEEEERLGREVERMFGEGEGGGVRSNGR